MTRLPALLVSLCLLGCGVFDPGRSTKDLDEARARWAERQPTTYEITVQRLCFCASVDPVRLQVSQGLVVSRTVTTTGRPLDPALADLYPAVPGIFSLLEDAYRRADQLTVTYNRQFGYPEQATIDYLKHAADDELTLKLSDFAMAPTVQGPGGR